MSQIDNNQITIRDLIYFDVAKAESILSQIEGGLVSEIESTTDTTGEQRNIRNYDFKVFRAEFGGAKSDSETTIERRRRHHEMCNLLERFLLSEGFAIDVNRSIDTSSIWDGSAHRLLAHYGYIKATGWASIEDYMRLQFILQKYNSIVEYIDESQLDNHPQLADLAAQIATIEQEIATISDRNKRKTANDRLKDLKDKLQKQRDDVLKQHQIEEWQVTGINNFIETFLKERINLFVFPFEEFLPFYMLSSLKRHCFIDTDVDNFIYSYGTRPNLKLTVLGLITSLPDPDVILPEFSQKFEHSKISVSDQLVLEKAFAQIFDGLQGVEGFFSFSHFPNVTLYPIAVYREIASRTQ